MPERLRFVSSPQGKPALAASFAGSRLRFNLAHSGDVALVAVAAGREVGVDVEQQRPLAEVGQIAERYFSPAERDTLARVAAADLPGVFFNIWSARKPSPRPSGRGWVIHSPALACRFRAWAASSRRRCRPAAARCGACARWRWARAMPARWWPRGSIGR